MRTLVQIYCWLRWPVLAVLAALWFSCPIAAVLTNATLGIILPIMLLIYHGDFTATDYIKQGFLAIGAYTAAAMLAIGALALFQTTLGWYTTSTDFTLGGMATLFAWILGLSTLFQVLCFVPAFEDLRRDLINNKGDIDI